MVEFNPPAVNVIGGVNDVPAAGLKKPSTLLFDTTLPVAVIKPAVLILPPRILPTDVIWPVVTKFPPTMLPVILARPGELMLPPVILPVAIILPLAVMSSVTISALWKLVNARFKSNNVIVAPESLLLNANS
jgi:hypothetical protein